MIVDGNLDDTWQITKIKHIAHVIMGQAPPGTSYNQEGQGIPLIAGASDLGTYSPHPTRWTTSPNQLCKPGDLIYCIRATIGNINWADREYCLGRGVAAIRAKSKLVDPSYLYYWLIVSKDVLTKLATGSTFVQIRRQDLEDLSIPLPSLLEQSRIVAILQQADRLCQLRREADEKAQQFLPALFYEMFGDPATNPKGWKVSSIETLLASGRKGITTGPFGSILKKGEYVEAGIPVWGINNIQPNEFVDEASYFITANKYMALVDYSVKEGDVLISRAGTVGRMCVAYPPQPQSIIGTNLIRVALNISSIQPEYFSALLTFFADKIGTLRASGDDSSYSFLNPSSLRSLRIALPPMPLQNEFVERVKEARKTRLQQRGCYQLLDNLLRSLLSHAFTGELTAAWREKHPEVSEEAQIFSDLFAKKEQETISTVNYDFTEELAVTTEAVFARSMPRPEVTTTLNIEQCNLLEAIYDLKGYFTMSMVQSNSSMSPHVVREGLQLFTSLGLIQEIRLPDRPMRNIVMYVPAYRHINEQDRAKERDLELLEKASRAAIQGFDPLEKEIFP